MPDNYGRMTASEMPPGLADLLFPRCPWRPTGRQRVQPPYFCPRCGLLGAHAGEPTAPEGEQGKEK